MPKALAPGSPGFLRHRKEFPKAYAAARKRPRVFLGYTPFYKNEHAPFATQWVSRDRTYLKACVLFKLGLISRTVLDCRLEPGGRKTVDACWRDDRRLTLRRVYAE